MMHVRLYILASLACAAALVASPVRAQAPQDQPQPQTQDPNASSENPSQPIPAIHSPLAGVNGNDQDDQQVPKQTVPDTTPLSGVDPYPRAERLSTIILLIHNSRYFPSPIR